MFLLKNLNLKSPLRHSAQVYPREPKKLKLQSPLAEPWQAEGRLPSFGFQLLSRPKQKHSLPSKWSRLSRIRRLGSDQLEKCIWTSRQLFGS